MRRLEGKVAIITGGARGMGASHVRRFVKEGAKVIFTDVLEAEGQALSKELGADATFVKHDVSKEDQWQIVVAQAEKIYGPVNILVNNAGIVVAKKVEEHTEADYRKVIDVNQVGVFLGMKSVLASMKKANGGAIVNISSINGLRGSAMTIAYDASKFAVRGMTKSAAMAFAEYGIRVNSVHPGVIDTPMVNQGDTKDMVAAIAQSIPLKRIGRPEDLTNLVLFLASDESSFCTGAEFIADGGAVAKY